VAIDKITDLDFKMSKILYVIAALFLIAWAIGFLYCGLGALIHLLLLVSMILVIIKLVKEK
jgi:hypothetical protein